MRWYWRIIWLFAVIVREDVMFTIRKQLAICLVLFLAVTAQLWLLKSLAYSTSWVTWLSAEDMTTPPPAPNFRVGGLEWDVDYYKRAPELQFFREYFEQHCHELKGIRAASCLSENLIKRIPKGTPKHEIFDAEFSPEGTFKSHLDGEKGYCVSYAGIAATSLLAVGIPARFLQVRPDDREGGHNIIEVWDDEKGWVLFDPFNDGLIENEGKYLSAIGAIGAAQVNHVKAGQDESVKGYLVDFYKGANPFGTTLVYPEPWLYTRVGAKENAFFRGTFVGFGNGYFKYSVVQNILRIGLVLCSIALAGAILFLVRSIVRMEKGHG